MNKMPRLDGSGPMGYGPQTGRGMGNCNGSQSLVNQNIYGRRSGRGNRRRQGYGNCMGFGFGNRWGRFGFQLSKQDEQSILTKQMETLQNQLDQVKQRLEEVGDVEVKD